MHNIKEWIDRIENSVFGDIIGAAALFAIIWGLMLIAAIFQGVAP